jgi:hypothetical protein
MNYGPKILTNGLVLALDTADKKSYIGSGTAWNDLSGNNNTGVLTNGPTFNSTNGGSIVFDGTNDYIVVNDSTSLQVADTFTVSAWIKATSLSSRHGVFSTRATNPAGAWQFEVGIGNSGTNRITLTGSGTFIADSVDNVITANVWTHICVVKINNATQGATLYVNGVSQSTSITTGYTISNNSDEKRIGIGTASSQYFPGSIALINLYNRALTTTEVLQNFNALRGRFGI